MPYVCFREIFNREFYDTQTSLTKVYELDCLATKPYLKIKSFFNSLVDKCAEEQIGIVDFIHSKSVGINKKQRSRYSEIPTHIQDEGIRGTTIKVDIDEILQKSSFFDTKELQKLILQESDQEKVKEMLKFLYKMVEYARLINRASIAKIYDKDTLLLCLLKDAFPYIVDDNPIQLDRESMENVESLYRGGVNISAYHALLIANHADYEEVSLVTFNGVVLFGLRAEQREKLIEIDSFIKESLARNRSPEEITQKITQILIDWDPGRGKTLLCELVTKAYGQIFGEDNRYLMVDGNCFGCAMDPVSRSPVINVQWLSLKDITEEEGINLDNAIKKRIEKMIRSAPANGKITIIIDEYPAMAYEQQKVINKLLPPDKYNLIFISATNNSVVQHKKTAPEEHKNENRLRRENYSIHSIELTPVIKDINTFTENYNGNIPVIVKNGYTYYIIGYSSSDDKVAYKLDSSLLEEKYLIQHIKWTNKPQLIQDINILKTAKQLIKNHKLHYPLVPSHKLELTRAAFYKQLQQSTDKLDIKCIDEDKRTLLDSLIQNTKSKLQGKKLVGDIQYILPDITTKEQGAFIEELKTHMKELDVDAILYQEKERTIDGEEVVKIKYVKRTQDGYEVKTLKDNETDIPGFTEKNRCLQLFSKANAVGGDYRRRARNVALQVIHSNSYLSYDQLMQYGNRHRTDEPAVEIYKQHETIILSKAKGIEELIAAAQRKQNNYEYKNALNVFRSDIIRSLFPSVDHKLYDTINCHEAVKLIMNHIRDTQDPNLTSILQFIQEQVNAAGKDASKLSPDIYNSFSNLIQYHDLLSSTSRTNIELTISQDISRYKGCLHEMGSIDYMPQKQQATIGGGGKITKLGVDLTDELDSKEKLDGKRAKLYTHKSGIGNITNLELVDGFNEEYLSCLKRMTKVCGKISSQYSKLYPGKGDTSVQGSEALNFDQCLSQFHALAKAKIGCGRIKDSTSKDLIEIPFNAEDIKGKSEAIKKLQSRAKKVDKIILGKIQEHFGRVISLLQARAESTVSATDEEIAFNLQNLLLLQKYKNLNVLTEAQFDQLKNAYLDILDKQLAGQNTVDNHKEVLTSKITEWLGAFKGSKDLDGKILERPKELRLALDLTRKQQEKISKSLADLPKKQERELQNLFNEEQKARTSLKLTREESLLRTQLQQAQEKERQEAHLSMALGGLQTEEMLIRTELQQEQERERQAAHLSLALGGLQAEESLLRTQLQQAEETKRQEQEAGAHLSMALGEMQNQESLLRTQLQQAEETKRQEQEAGAHLSLALGEEESARQRVLQQEQAERSLRLALGEEELDRQRLQQEQAEEHLRLALEELKIQETILREKVAQEQNSGRKVLKDAKRENRIDVELQNELAKARKTLQEAEEQARQRLNGEEDSGINTLELAAKIEKVVAQQQETIRNLTEKLDGVTGLIASGELTKRLDLRKIRKVRKKPIKLEESDALRNSASNLQVEPSALAEVPPTRRDLTTGVPRRRNRAPLNKRFTLTDKNSGTFGVLLDALELGKEQDVHLEQPSTPKKASGVRQRLQQIVNERTRDGVENSALSENQDAAAQQLLGDLDDGANLLSNTSQERTTNRHRIKIELLARPAADDQSITPPSEGSNSSRKPGSR